MKIRKLLSGVLASAMLITTVMTPAYAKTFPDTTNHWAKSAIGRLSDYGILKGDNKGNFRPNDSITRAETATMIDNTVSYTAMGTKTFSDVKSTDWFATSVSKLSNAGVITGYENGTFQPNSKISRQDACVMISRAFGFKVSSVATTALDVYTDKASVGTWAKGAVAYMTTNGYIKGSDGKFRPTDPITRAEITTIVDNIIGIYANGGQASYSGDYGKKIAVIKSATVFNGVTLGGAVISPKVTGTVAFNTGTKINGTLYNLSSLATVTKSGAVISSEVDGTVTTPSQGSTSGSSTGSSSSNGLGGGSSSSSSDTYRVVFDANGGEFDNGSETVRVTYSYNERLKGRMPDDPEHDRDYDFVGWFTSQDAADDLDEDELVSNNEPIRRNYTFYAGWDKDGDYDSDDYAEEIGEFSAAKGSNICGLGKKATELMDNVKITANSSSRYTIKGELLYVTDYDEFADEYDSESEGYFLAITYELPRGVDYPEKVTVESSGAGNKKETFDDFDDDEDTYTRVFYIEEDELDDGYLRYDIEFDSREDDFEDVSVKLYLNKLDLSEGDAETVSTETEFVNALYDRNVTTIIVDDEIELEDGETYESRDDAKRVILEQPFTMESNSDVIIKNIEFETKDTLNTFIETRGGKSLTLEDVTIEGEFKTIIEEGLDELVIKDCTFVCDNVSSSVAIDAGKIDTEITGTKIEGFKTGLVYTNIETVLEDNEFVDNTVDIKLNLETDMDNIPDLSGNELTKSKIKFEGDAIEDLCFVDEDDAFVFMIDGSDVTFELFEDCDTIDYESGMTVKVVAREGVSVQIQGVAQDEIDLDGTETNIEIKVGTKTKTIAISK